MKHSPYILKAARSLLGWKQSVLAEKSGVSINTVRRLESTESWEQKWDTSSVIMIKKIQEAFEKNGVKFIPKNGGGPGVRLKE